MQIEYTKAGMKITHSTGVVQVLTLDDLYRHWEQAKEREQKSGQYTKKAHDNIKKVETS